MLTGGSVPVLLPVGGAVVRFPGPVSPVALTPTSVEKRGPQLLGGLVLRQ
jgi:hypothetical protein